MPLKLKLKVNPSKTPAIKKEKDAERISAEPKLPKIKIKHSAASHDSVGGISKPKAPKEKLKKLKISLGKSNHGTPISSGAVPETNGPVQPILKKVPKVRIKPTRVPGEGYDSEAPDVEDDPLIEQAIAVRFLNDANLDFLHSAADTGDFSNVNIKWITRDKAVVNVNLTLYSARLIDLPTLTELYKTIDKKNIFKTIDVSQILLVLRTINPKNLNMETDFDVPEKYTYTHPLYTLSVNKEIRASKTAYRHGLSNSFDDVYRRFRPKKVNHRLMADIELRVDEIVRRDNEAQESHYEYVNPKLQSQHLRVADGSRPQDTLQRTSSMASQILRPDLAPESVPGVEDHEDDEDGEDDQMALDLEADLDIALEQELADALDSTSNTTAATVLMKSEYDNDDMDEGAVTGANDDDEDDDEDEDDEDDDEEEDEDVKEDMSRAKKLEEEIADLQSAAEKQKLLLATASYKMMRMKFQSAYNNLKSQLDLKKRELAKLREQQTKQQAGSGHTDQGVRKGTAEDDEDEDDVDDEDEDENADADAEDERGAREPTNEAERQESFDSGNAFTEDDTELQQQQQQHGDADDAEMNDANDEDNYDDFQGLF